MHLNIVRTSICLYSLSSSQIGDNKTIISYSVKYSLPSVFSNLYLLLVTLETDFIEKKYHINFIDMIFLQACRSIYTGFVFFSIIITAYSVGFFHTKMIILFYTCIVIHFIGIYQLVNSVIFKNVSSALNSSKPQQKDNEKDNTKNVELLYLLNICVSFCFSSVKTLS